MSEYTTIIQLKKNKRILIVDDEPFNIIGIQLNLNNLGINGIT